MTQTTQPETQAIDELLPIGVAARELGVAIETLRRWDAAGEIRTVRTPGGQRRFARSEVDRLRAGRPLSA